MRSELRTLAALTAVAALALAPGDARGGGGSCGDPIEPGQVACPDLTLATTGTSPLDTGSELVIPVRVENRGNADSPATRVVATAPGWDSGEADVEEVASGQSRDVSIRLAIPDDQRGTTSVFTLVVDPDGEVDDQDPDNNTLRVRAEIGEAPQPDLQVSAPSHELIDDSRVAIAVVVTNIGEETSPQTTLVVTGDGWDETRTPVGALEPGSDLQLSVELSIPESARGTTSTLDVTATPVAGEPDTTNNSVRHEVVVESVPDLALSVSGDQLVDGGEKLELQARIKNVGSGDAPATRLVATAPDWQEASADVSALAAGDSTDVTVALVVPESQRGQRRTFVLEVEAVSGEEVTDNNTTSRAVDIPVAGEDEGSDWIVPALIAVAIAALGLLVWLLRSRRRVPAAAPHDPVEPEPVLEPPTDVLVPTPTRVVNTGFAAESSPAAPLDPAVTLVCGASYLFWLDIGPPVARSAERTPVDLPWGQLPPSPELTVAVFSLSDGDAGFALDTGGDLGSLIVGASGAVEVGRQPGPVGVPIASTRLLFPVRAPLVEADAQLRCSIYCRGTLVQSRLVTARVRREPTREYAAGFESVLDFTLAPALDPLHLAKLPEPTLTVMLNRSDATHDFTFYGAGGFKSQSSFGELEVQDLDQPGAWRAAPRGLGGRAGMARRS